MSTGHRRGRREGRLGWYTILGLILRTPQWMQEGVTMGSLLGGWVVCNSWTEEKLGFGVVRSRTAGE